MRFEFIKDVRGAGEAHAAVAFVIFLQHDSPHERHAAVVVPQLNLSSNADAFAGAEQGPPRVRRDFFHEQQFDLPAADWLMAVQTRADDAGVV